jgi:hypothetical protein
VRRLWTASINSWRRELVKSPLPTTSANASIIVSAESSGNAL